MKSNPKRLRKLRRKNLAAEILQWIHDQPEQRVPLSDYEKRVGQPDLIQSLLSNEFMPYELGGEIWVSSRTYLKEQLTSQAVRWMHSFPNGKVSRSALNAWISERGYPLNFLPLDAFMLLDSNSGAWVQPIPDFLQQYAEILRMKFDRAPDHMADEAAFAEWVGGQKNAQVLLGQKLFRTAHIGDTLWVFPAEQDTPTFQAALAKKQALYEAERKGKYLQEWETLAANCGDVLRPGASKAQTPRLYVIARTYTEPAAAKRLTFPAAVIHSFITNTPGASFVDPDGRLRIPARLVEAIAADETEREKVAQFVPLHTRDIALAAGISYEAARYRLKKAGLSPAAALWGEVRGKWGLPSTYREYDALLKERYPAWLAAESERRGGSGAAPEGERRFASGKQREERARLHAELLRMFPTWDSQREDQRFYLHSGPTNSGKTYQSILRLAEMGSGWYLAPLRLLAHEIFDTLNKRGVPCNLLTGEEAQVVPGARITAATIEMFSPNHSGSCVVIDEAHMLADSQRGWAWTRALMEAKSQEIHIIGAPICVPLVRKIASEAGMQLEEEIHERLTPLEVADKPWKIDHLPAKTILVAFSRRTVLGLKAELEKRHHRTVSVVYGNLPPEVRLKQAERFANGETEICVATDAVGMGLNLPAENVCFFEVMKFDGAEMRLLSDNEIRQIAGRAGRFGLSEKGMVGALNTNDLAVLRNAISSQQVDIEFARVAPGVESLGILPGDLSEKLASWMTLAGIPPKWKEILKPADLSSQIELAKKLTAEDVKSLGEAQALQLVNAPCYESSQAYWLKCAQAIIDGEKMPAPPVPNGKIHSAVALESFEIAIRQADIYLWLSQRREFAEFAPDYTAVRNQRSRLAETVDAALLERIDTTRRCKSCGRPLAVNYRYNVCSGCFDGRRGRW